MGCIDALEIEVIIDNPGTKGEPVDADTQGNPSNPVQARIAPDMDSLPVLVVNNGNQTNLVERS